MKRKTKGGIILTSLAAIAVAGSLLAGSTYALFTSESKTNIAVESGKVDVVASISELEAFTPTEINADGTISDPANKATKDEGTGIWTFGNGGTATLKGQELKLDKMVPGDSVSFKIKIENNSNVAIKYRTFVSCSADDGLFEGLKCTIGTDEFEGGLSKKSSWTELAASATLDTPLECSVSLPATAGNDYQDKTCTISYTVEAVQGNAKTEDAAEGTYELYTVSDLKWFQKNASKITKYQTVKLMNDIDLNGEDWVPAAYGKTFYGIFDGNEKWISNFNISGTLDVGFISSVQGSDVTGAGTVKNVWIKDCTVRGAERVGAVVGRICEGTISNCKVENTNVIGIWNTIEGEGPSKLGAILGDYDLGSDTTIKDFTASNCNIYGTRSVGGFIGRIRQGNYNIQNFTGNDIKVYEVYDTKTGSKYDSTQFGYDIGSFLEALGQNNSGITSNNVEIIKYSTIGDYDPEQIGKVN